jgi:hypothetical protein
VAAGGKSVSGTKYSTLNVSEAILEMLRQQILARQEKRQIEAMERQRIGRLNRVKDRLLAEAGEVQQFLILKQTQLDIADEKRLQPEMARIFLSIRQAHFESQLAGIPAALGLFHLELDRAMNSQCEAEAHPLETELAETEKEEDRYAAFLPELQRRWDAVPAEDGIRFDPDGRVAAARALEDFEDALSASGPVAKGETLAYARQALAAHEERVAEGRGEWERRRSEAESAVGEIEDVIEGLKADPVAMRWRSRAVADLQNVLSDATAALLENRFDRPARLLAEARLRKGAIAKEAGDAQLKTDQRDYIVNSLRQTLEEMGFSVGPTQMEYPDHPASAALLRAASASGKEIAISVPVEGEVWYEADGYPMKTETTIDGDTAVTRGGAESLINEMNEALEVQFGVSSGELQWEGKADPNRILRQADALPYIATRTRAI